MVIVPARQKPKYGMAGIIPGHPLTPDFFLAMNEGGGNEVWDLLSKNNKHDFYSGGNPKWVGSGIDFDEDYEYIIVDNFNSVIPAGQPEGTIAFYIEKPTVAPTNFCYAYSVGTNFTTFSFLTNPAGTVPRIYFNGTNLIGSVTESIYDYKIIAVTWDVDAPTGNIKLYYDGVLISSDTGSISVPTSTDPLYVGNRGETATGRAFGAIMSGFYIKRRVLSGAEIASLSANPYQWMYNKSEALSRSIWYISGGGGDISGTASGLAVLAGLLEGSGILNGGSTGAGEATANIFGTGQLVALSEGICNVSATLFGSGSLSGQLNGTCNLLALLSGIGELSGLSEGICTIEGVLINATPTGEISGIIDGTSEITGNIFGTGYISGLSEGHAILSGNLIGLSIADISGLVEGNCILSGVLRDASQVIIGEITITFSSKSPRIIFASKQPEINFTSKKPYITFN